MSNLPETMNPDVAHKLLKVGEAFRIPGPFFSYEEIKMGNVNHTYKVNYIRDDGSGMAKIKSYLVQRVNTYAFQKPLELIRRLVLASSRPGDLVLDPFMGSGSTAVVCKQSGRAFVGFEVDPEYHRKAQQRVRKASAAGPAGETEPENI